MRHYTHNKERIATANHLCLIMTLARQGMPMSEIIAIFLGGLEWEMNRKV
jgi:hypothetical protein